MKNDRFHETKSSISTLLSKDFGVTYEKPSSSSFYEKFKSTYESITDENRLLSIPAEISKDKTVDHLERNFKRTLFEINPKLTYVDKKQEQPCDLSWFYGEKQERKEKKEKEESDVVKKVIANLGRVRETCEKVDGWEKRFGKNDFKSVSDKINGESAEMLLKIIKKASE